MKYRNVKRLRASKLGNPLLNFLFFFPLPFSPQLRSFLSILFLLFRRQCLATTYSGCIGLANYSLRSKSMCVCVRCGIYAVGIVGGLRRKHQSNTSELPHRNNQGWSKRMHGRGWSQVLRPCPSSKSGGNRQPIIFILDPWAMALALVIYFEILSTPFV